MAVLSHSERKTTEKFTESVDRHLDQQAAERRENYPSVPQPGKRGTPSAASARKPTTFDGEWQPVGAAHITNKLKDLDRLTSCEAFIERKAKSYAKSNRRRTKKNAPAVGDAEAFGGANSLTKTDALEEYHSVAIPSKSLRWVWGAAA